MKAPEIRYVRAGGVDEALAMLAAAPDVTKVLAGGQSLLPVLNLRLADPEILLDITKVPELHGSGGGPDGRWHYGACTLHADLEDGRVADVASGLLRFTARGIGYRAIRNRGTIGGSLAHADPSAEWPVVMAALDAAVLARSTVGRREIACVELFQGYFTTALNEDEILTDVLVAPLPTGSTWGLCKFARKAGEFAESIAVVVLVRDGPTTTAARVWLGCAGSTPLPLPRVQAALTGSTTWTEHDVLALVAADLIDAGTPSSTDRYRRHLHGVTVWRAVTDALADGPHREQVPGNGWSGSREDR